MLDTSIKIKTGSNNLSINVLIHSISNNSNAFYKKYPTVKLFARHNKRRNLEYKEFKISIGLGYNTKLHNCHFYKIYKAVHNILQKIFVTSYCNGIKNGT